jgi:hypothetical protein
MRRASILLAALSVGILIYFAFAVLIYNKVTGWMCVLTSSPPTVPLDQNGLVNVFGYQIRCEFVVMVASLGPCCWIASAIFRSVRRRNRELLGECLNCGFPLQGMNGRCPRCLLRYEAAPRRRQGFPVKVQHANPGLHGRYPSR